MSELEVITKCLHQRYKLDNYIQLPEYMRFVGIGDCTTCVADDKNGHCLCYVPTKIYLIHVDRDETK